MESSIKSECGIGIGSGFGNMMNRRDDYDCNKNQVAGSAKLVKKKQKKNIDVNESICFSSLEADETCNMNNNNQNVSLSSNKKKTSLAQINNKNDNNNNISINSSVKDDFSVDERSISTSRLIKLAAATDEPNGKNNLSKISPNNNNLNNFRERMNEISNLRLILEEKDEMIKYLNTALDDIRSKYENLKSKSEQNEKIIIDFKQKEQNINKELIQITNEVYYLKNKFKDDSKIKDDKINELTTENIKIKEKNEKSFQILNNLNNFIERIYKRYNEKYYNVLSFESDFSLFFDGFFDFIIEKQKNERIDEEILRDEIKDLKIENNLLK